MTTMIRLSRVATMRWKSELDHWFTHSLSDGSKRSCNSIDPGASRRMHIPETVDPSSTEKALYTGPSIPNRREQRAQCGHQNCGASSDNSAARLGTKTAPAVPEKERMLGLRPPYSWDEC